MYSLFRKFCSSNVRFSRILLVNLILGKHQEMF